MSTNTSPVDARSNAVDAKSDVVDARSDASRCTVSRRETIANEPAASRDDSSPRVPRERPLARPSCPASRPRAVRLVPRRGGVGAYQALQAFVDVFSIASVRSRGRICRQPGSPTPITPARISPQFCSRPTGTTPSLDWGFATRTARRARVPTLANETICRTVRNSYLSIAGRTVDARRNRLDRTARSRETPEGGYYAETYAADAIVDEAHLPARYDDDRPTATGIYYLLEADDFSAFHRLRSDEIWHFYRGDPLTLYVLDDGLETIELGRDRFQAVVPTTPGSPPNSRGTAATTATRSSAVPSRPDFTTPTSNSPVPSWPTSTHYGDLIVRLTRRANAVSDD